VAQVVAVLRGGRVGFVVHPFEVQRTGAREEQRARHREERAPKRHARIGQRAQHRHAGHALQSRAAHELQEHGLGLVVEVVRERDVGLRARGVDAIARFAGGRLEAAARIARDLHALDGKRDAARSAEALAERGPAIGVGRQAVVNVHRGEGTAALARQRVEQHDRIHSAGKSDAHRRARRQGAAEATRPVP